MMLFTNKKKIAKSVAQDFASDVFKNAVEFGLKKYGEGYVSNVQRY